MGQTAWHVLERPMMMDTVRETLERGPETFHRVDRYPFTHVFPPPKIAMCRAIYFSYCAPPLRLSAQVRAPLIHPAARAASPRPAPPCAFCLSSVFLCEAGVFASFRFSPLPSCFSPLPASCILYQIELLLSYILGHFNESLWYNYLGPGVGWPSYFSRLSSHLRLRLFVAGFWAMIFSQAGRVRDAASTSFGMR